MIRKQILLWLLFPVQFAFAQQSVSLSDCQNWGEGAASVAGSERVVSTNQQPKSRKQRVQLFAAGYTEGTGYLSVGRNESWHFYAWRYNSFRVERSIQSLS